MSGIRIIIALLHDAKCSKAEQKKKARQYLAFFMELVMGIGPMNLVITNDALYRLSYTSKALRGRGTICIITNERRECKDFLQKPYFSYRCLPWLPGIASLRCVKGEAGPYGQNRAYPALKPGTPSGKKYWEYIRPIQE